MAAFSATPNEPTTYQELLSTPAFTPSEADSHRLETVSASLTRMRLDLSADIPLHTADVTRLLTDLESVGVRAWYGALQMQNAVQEYAQWEMEMEGRQRGIDELREMERRERERVDGLIRERCALVQEVTSSSPLTAIAGAPKQNHEREAVRKLKFVAERLGRLVGRLSRVIGVEEVDCDELVGGRCETLHPPAFDDTRGANGKTSNQTTDAEVLKKMTCVAKTLDRLVDQFGQFLGAEESDGCAPSPKSHGDLPSIEENDDKMCTHDCGCGQPEKSPTEDFPAHDDTKTWGPSSLLAEAGSLFSPPSPDYPPPLNPGSASDAQKTAMLTLVSTTLWHQENKDRDFPPRQPPPTPTVAQLPPSSPQIHLNDHPYYLYLPLPPNFTIPQSNPHLPTLTFPTPPSVFYFPERGTRDQLMAILHRGCAGGVRDEYLEPIDEVNIIRVRTLEFEWELKNAVRKVLTREEWDGVVNGVWGVEGRGDTFIVSKRDVRFVGLGEEKGDEEGNSDGGGTSRRGSEERDEEEMLQLKGGGGLEAFPDFSPSLPSQPSCCDRPPRSLREHCEISTFTPGPSDDAHAHLNAWVERARVLQLQNASYNRMIAHLQEILKDAEDTVQWQDEELARAYRHIGDLERRVRDARQESLGARRDATHAEAEVQRLEDEMVEINEKVMQFCAELDEKEKELLARYAGLLAPESPRAATLRGGGRSGSQSPTETITQTVEAHSFFWFPSVSYLVLLSNPLHHWQLPKHTTLTQAITILQARYTQRKETGPHIQRVLEILDTRADAGIRLPDTSDGRQVFISAPADEDDAASEKSPVHQAGSNAKGKWSRTPGSEEYEYESRLKDSISQLDVTTADAASHISLPTPLPDIDSRASSAEDLVLRISPSDSDGRYDDVDEDEFFPTGPLIQKLEHEAALSVSLSRASSLHNAPFTSDLIPRTSSPNLTPTSAPRSRGSSLGSRRGFTSSLPLPLPLPPTTLPQMFPTPSALPVSPPISPRLQHYVTSAFVAPERSSTPHSASMLRLRPWRVVRYPPLRTAYLCAHGGVDELERSAGFEHEMDLSGRASSVFPSFSSSGAQDVREEGKEGDWTPFRHARTSGCETWLPPSPTSFSVEHTRTHCSFCALPFLPSPSSSRSSPPPFDLDPSNPYLRGGGEELEADWVRYRDAADFELGCFSWSHGNDIHGETSFPTRPGNPLKYLVYREEEEDGYDGSDELSCAGALRRRRVRRGCDGEGEGEEDGGRCGRFGGAGREAGLSGECVGMTRYTDSTPMNPPPRRENGKPARHQDANDIRARRNARTTHHCPFTHPHPDTQHEETKKHPMPTLSKSACYLSRTISFSPPESWQGRWIPSTVAGPSCPPSRGKREAQVEEYDGMLLPSYSHQLF